MRTLFSAVLAVVLVLGAWLVYELGWAENVNRDKRAIHIKIPTGSNYSDVVAILRQSDAIRNYRWFELMAKLKRYDRSVRPGHYVLRAGMNNRQIVNMLRAGLQTPVKLVLNQIQTKEDFASRVGRTLEMDSAQVIQLLTSDSFCRALNSDTDNVLANFIADNYELYWNSSWNSLVQKLLKANRTFWNQNARLAKAELLGLGTAEVVTLASIVEKECIYDSELPRVAGVYLNRLRIKMPLQADPTLKYAMRDFAARRVVNVHKEFDSPYNTYLYAGLPPGPICMPRKRSIDAVLNAEQHSYIYFCANPDMSGHSIFSKTYEEHMKVARLYQRTLSKMGIR